MEMIKDMVDYMLLNTIYMYDAPNWCYTYFPVIIGFFN